MAGPSVVQVSVKMDTGPVSGVPAPDGTGLGMVRKAGCKPWALPGKSGLSPSNSLYVGSTTFLEASAPPPPLAPESDPEQADRVPVRATAATDAPARPRKLR